MYDDAVRQHTRPKRTCRLVNVEHLPDARDARKPAELTSTPTWTHHHPIPNNPTTFGLTPKPVPTMWSIVVDSFEEQKCVSLDFRGRSLMSMPIARLGWKFVEAPNPSTCTRGPIRKRHRLIAGHLFVAFNVLHAVPAMRGLVLLRGAWGLGPTRYNTMPRSPPSLDYQMGLHSSSLLTRLIPPLGATKNLVRSSNRPV